MKQYVPRAFERFGLDLPVRAIVDSILPRIELDGRAKDLGGGGIKAELFGEIREGTRVILELLYRWGSVRFQGTVAWKRPLNETVLHGFGFDVPIGDVPARMMSEDASEEA